MTILFETEGQRFLALNGGPHFKFTPAISLIVDCATQAEVDELWDRLGEGGAPGQMRLAHRQVRSQLADRAELDPAHH
jgi:predicted 3-demethylubiquinone-9 3-methyltransferase (glyoxalase superfamily)